MTQDTQRVLIKLQELRAKYKFVIKRFNVLQNRTSFAKICEFVRRNIGFLDHILEIYYIACQSVRVATQPVL